MKKLVLSERILFSLIFFIQLIIMLFLIGSHSLTAGHDGFQYFSQQYYFLNNVFHAREIPQWVPYMTHGTVATWWYSIQAGLLQSVLCLMGNWLKGFNFLPIYNTGIFIDQLLLLTGTWLLAKRFFSSEITCFFVASTVMGSCIWMSQPWWNFHFYYALPLILHYGHSFLETGRWRYFFLAGNLLAIQTLGNLPYFIPVITLVIFLYFLFYFIFNHSVVLEQLKNVSWSAKSFLSLGCLITSLIIVYGVLKFGTNLIINYNAGRQADGSVSLETFLTYAGNTGLAKWLELFLGISPALDYTVFIGFLPLILIFLGLLINREKKYYPFIILTVILVLFSMGNFVSIFFYYVWPLMKFYRHLALVAPIVKLFLCFLAGIGFEAVFIKEQFKPSSHLLLFSSAMMFGVSMILFTLAHKLSLSGRITDFLVSTGLPSLTTGFLSEELLYHRLVISFIYALFTYLLIGFLPVIPFQKYRLYIVSIALSLHLLNLYEYNLSEINLRTVPLNPDQYKITAFQDIPFIKKRDISFWKDNPRAALIATLPIPKNIYWSTHPFLFKDQIGNPFRTDHWLLPFDQFMKAYWGQPLDDSKNSPMGWAGWNLIFPSKHPAALKIAGFNEDKIQFFSEAYILDHEKTIAKNISAPQYKGDILFLSQPPQKTDPKHFRNLKWAAPRNLSVNTRLNIPYEIQNFSSNHLEVSADTTGYNSPWLFYSDVWHPQWRATVNGEPTQIFKADLAYKAVPLKLGLNKIHFYFQSKFLNFLYFLIGMNALFWVGLILWLTGRLCLRENYDN